MQRPVMNPMFLDPEPKVPMRRSVLRRLWAVARLVVKILLSDVRFWRKTAQLKIEDDVPLMRFLRGFSYRLLAVPALLAFLATSLVLIGTHPPQSRALADPATHGMYYDPVNFISSDGVRLEGWLVPALQPKLVLQEGDKALRKKHPAVVLVHDVGANGSQLAPLMQPLHDAGYVVLAVNVRGAGGSDSSAVTFGLREFEDVRAAVDLLRRRPAVDPRRIAVLGVGTGANAAILAAERDPRIAVLILDQPITSPDSVVNDRLGPRQSWLQWMRPMCKWTFELMYRVDADDLDIQRHAPVLETRPVLMFSQGTAAKTLNAHGIAQIRQFLGKHLPEPPEAHTFLIAEP